MIVGIKERWQDLQSMFAAMDVNRDGKISDEEFKVRAHLLLFISLII